MILQTLVQEDDPYIMGVEQMQSCKSVYITEGQEDQCWRKRRTTKVAIIGIRLLEGNHGLKGADGF